MNMPVLRGRGLVWKFGLIVFALIVAVPKHARAQAEDTLEVGAWELDLTGKLSASQASYRAWQEGGVNTLAFTTGLVGQGERETPNWRQKHELRLAFGLIHQESFEDDGFRKSEDAIRLNSSLQYTGNGVFHLFNPTIAISARTQFAHGFNYDKVPQVLKDQGYSDEDLPVLVSAFLSPGTFTQTIGLTYDPAPWFTQRLGIAAKETVVLVERLRPIYNPDGERIRPEVGVESRTEFDREVAENVRLKSSLALFTAFNDPEVPDALWENVATMKVNSWLSVDFEFVTLFDRDVSDAAQIKEVLSLGVSFVFI